MSINRDQKANLTTRDIFGGQLRNTSSQDSLLSLMKKQVDNSEMQISQQKSVEYDMLDPLTHIKSNKTGGRLMKQTKHMITEHDHRPECVF